MDVGTAVSILNALQKKIASFIIHCREVNLSSNIISTEYDVLISELEGIKNDIKHIYDFTDIQNLSSEFPSFITYKTDGVGNAIRVLSVYVSRLQFLIESRLNTPDVIAQKETKIKEIENSINDLCSFCNEYYKSVSGNYVKNHPVQKISPEHSSQGGAVSIGKKLSSTVAELRNILGRIEQISESLISSESGQQQQ